jgi:hypothetical protein
VDEREANVSGRGEKPPTTFEEIKEAAERETATLVDEMRGVARGCGYALAEHGSKRRDLDLVAAPWTEHASSPDALVDALEERLGMVATRRGVEKPHGRLGYILAGRRWREGGDHQPIDLSVMPCKEVPRFWSYKRAKK